MNIVPAIRSQTGLIESLVKKVQTMKEQFREQFMNMQKELITYYLFSGIRTMTV
jgi:hypothetical protein